MAMWSRWTNNPTQDWDSTPGLRHGLLLLCREAAGQVFPALGWNPFVEPPTQDNLQKSTSPDIYQF